jgi:hypothetical protein
MKRSRHYLVAMLVCVGVWTSGDKAQAGVIAVPPSGPTRVAGADAVIVGRVDALEPEDVKAGNTTYRIAVVRINEGIKGTKGEKTLRVGFIPVQQPEKGKPIIVRRPRPVQLEAGMDGLFILGKHATENFYTIRGVTGYFITSDMNKDCAKEVQVAKAAAKVLENPQAALKAKDAEERLLAAAVLIEKYRTSRGPNPKLEPIDAAESKQILQALVDADWTANLDLRSMRPNLTRLFQRLGVTKNDGFAPAAGETYQAAVQTWLRENAQTYRIQRYAAEEKN